MFKIIIGILKFLWGILVCLALVVFAAVKFCIPLWCFKKKRIENRVIVITGTGSGIGRALALEFAKFHPILVLISKHEPTNLETVRLIRERFDGDEVEVHSFTCDVGRREEVFDCISEVRRTISPVDILVNNAGIVQGRYLYDLSEEEIRETLQANLLSHYWTTQAVLPTMLTTNHGHIVAISSVAGIVGTAQLTDYCASKFGIVGFMESLDVELRNMGKNGIKLTTVCPYFVDTGLFKGIKTNYQLLLPILKSDYVAKRAIDAVLTEQEVLYMPRMLYVLLGAKGLLPMPALRHMGYLFGAHTAMGSFIGRSDIV